MNKRGENFIPWIIAIIVFLIAIPIVWNVVSSVTETNTGTIPAENEAVTHVAFKSFAHNPTTDNNAVCTLKTAKKGATYLTATNYTLDSTVGNCAIKSKVASLNGTWALNYTYAYNNDGYIDDSLSRTIVGFFTVFVALGALAFVAIKVKG